MMNMEGGEEFGGEGEQVEGEEEAGQTTVAILEEKTLENPRNHSTDKLESNLLGNKQSISEIDWKTIPNNTARSLPSYIISDLPSLLEQNRPPIPRPDSRHSINADIIESNNNYVENRRENDDEGFDDTMPSFRPADACTVQNNWEYISWQDSVRDQAASTAGAGVNTPENANQTSPSSTTNSIPIDVKSPNQTGDGRTNLISSSAPILEQRFENSVEETSKTHESTHRHTPRPRGRRTERFFPPKFTKRRESLDTERRSRGRTRTLSPHSHRVHLTDENTDRILVTPQYERTTSAPPYYGSNDIVGDDDVSSDGDEDEKEADFSLRKMNRRQLMTLLLMGISNFTSYACLSVPGPFYPSEATSKGLSNTNTGWVFSIFALTEFIFGPICGKLLPVVGSRFMFLTGTFFAGGTTVVFGLLDFIPYQEDQGLMFLIFCLVTRVLMALGCSVFGTASFAIIINEFPDSIAFVLGVLETFTGLGMMLGPAIGGVLYDLGGFHLPFSVLGGIMVLTVPIGWCMLPVQDDEKHETASGSLRKIMCNPSCILILIAITDGALIWSALDPTLQPHLVVFDLSSEIIGLVFLLASALYAVTAPIWGKVADKMEDSKWLLIAGFLLSAVGLLLIGPSPLLTLENYNELWLNLVAITLLGVSCSLAVIPTFDLIMWVAEDAGMEDNLGTYGIVAGLWTSAYALGDFLGPFMGGWLLDMVGFNWAMTYVAGSCVVVSFLLMGLMMQERCKEKKCLCYEVEIDYAKNCIQSVYRHPDDQPSEVQPLLPENTDTMQAMA